LSIYSNTTIFKNPLKAGNNNYDSISDCIKMMNKELLEKREVYQQMVLSQLHKITAELYRSHCYELNSDSMKTSKNTNNVLKKSFDLIDKCFAEQITLTDIASACNISIPHFSRLFKSYTGMTFK
jgi:YesN/AraC family two-component response regulator